MSEETTRTVRVKVTWEAYMYEMLRILNNPHATLTTEGRIEMSQTMLKVARMADAYVNIVEEE